MSNSIDLATCEATWREQGKTRHDVSLSPPVGPFRRPQHTPPLCCLLCERYHQTSKMVSVVATRECHRCIPCLSGNMLMCVISSCDPRQGLSCTNY